MRAAILCLCSLLALTATADEIADLVKALGDDDYDTRERAAERLTEIGDAAIPALREAANSEDAEVRAKAGKALAQIEWRTALPAAFLKKYPAAADEILVADDESLIRWIQMLGVTCPGVDVVPAAMRFMDMGTGRAKKDALLLVSRRASALATLRDPASLERLVPLLTDPEPGLRVLALSVAGEWGRATGKAPDALDEVVKRRVLPPALSALDARDGTVRSAAARALGRIGDSAAVKRLSESAVDSVSAVRMAAIEALGAIGDPRGAAAAARGLDDEGTDVVRSAIDACARMKSKDAAPAIRAAMAVEGRAPILRQAALEALAAIDPPGIEDAKGCLADENAALRAAAWRIILASDATDAVKAAADEDAEVRLVAAAALARAPRDAAVPALLALLDDDRSATLRDARGNDVARGEIRLAAMASLESVTRRKSAGEDDDARVADWKKWAAAGGK
ncbi:MAG: HEAT repeat domain-containing protein [Planctomycetota bacterium]